MPTTNVSISYRPVRIGFLIENDNLADLLKCCEINTLLWGGAYNPIIPVGCNEYLIKQFINLFSVDILLPISNNTKIAEIIKKYTYLKEPHHMSEHVFYEDSLTKKQLPYYLDVIHLIDHYWKEEFKHAKEADSNCAYVSWDAKDPLNSIFTLMFGAYPKGIDLKSNYPKAFKNGLLAKEIIIKDKLEADLANMLTPINLTKGRLFSYNGYGYAREDGVYIGSEKTFSDLMLFWNLRASGINLIFLPTNNLERFKDFTKMFLGSLDKRPSQYPNFEDWIGIYFSTTPEEEVKSILKTFKTNKKSMLSHITDTSWNGLNIKPSLSAFKPSSTLSIIENKNDKYTVAIPLPKKPFSEDQAGIQNYAISINMHAEFEYPGHTLQLPYLPDLNEFYGRQATFHPFTLRVEKDGFGLIENMGGSSVTLHPIPIIDVLIQVFKHAKIDATLSPAGRLASLIIKKMGNIEECRVFKITGVRKLLKIVNEKISWKKGEIIIFKERFEKFFNLYIEPRKGRKLTANDVLKFLIEKKVFVAIPSLLYKAWVNISRRTREFNCSSCGYKSNILMTKFQDNWKCRYCGFEHYLPLFIRKELRNDLKSWFIKKGGIFTKDNNQEGSLPVILTIMQLNRCIGGSIKEGKWCTSLELSFDGKKCETDFAMIHSRSRYNEDALQVAIGECKDGVEIDDKDIDNLCIVKEKLEKSGIGCWLVFSKTSDSFLPSEIDRFKKLVQDKDIKPILFTNIELEPYELYWEHPKQSSLPNKYPHSFEEIAENSIHIYLDDVRYTKTIPFKPPSSKTIQ